MNARDAAIWADINQMDKWIDRAQDEVDEIDPAAECEYETQRAYAWRSYLEDRRERLTHMLSGVA